ncbi:Serine/threonine-protein kinase 16, partial [Podochytrium sp. JEL0797]
LRHTLQALQHKLLDCFDVLSAFFSTLLASFHKQPLLRLKNRRFSVVRQLGEGGFSYVFLVKEANVPPAQAELYALKRIRVQLPEQEQRLRQEIAAHGAVSSDHVLKLLDSQIVRGNDLSPSQRHTASMEMPVLAEGLLLLPYYGGGTVQDLIDNLKPGETLPLTRILEIAADVARGLLAFHKKSPPLAFRDLKPANILLSSPTHTPTHPQRAILMDLGSVAPARLRITTRREAVALQELCAETVTAPFRAPELFDPSSDSVVDERSDTWAFGCVLWCLAYQAPPFDGSMTAAVSGQVQFPMRDAYGEQFRRLVREVLVTDPKERLFMDQVLMKVENLLGSLGSA